MRWSRSGLCLLVVGCSQDASFTKLADPEPSARDTSAPPAEPDLTPPPPPECPDAGLVSAAPVDRDPDCLLVPETIPLDIVTEWTSIGLADDASPYTSSHPSIGDMTADGIPDIGMVAFDSESVSAYNAESTVVRLLSGDGDHAGGPRIHWEVSDLSEVEVGLEVAPTFDTAMGDVDGDGSPELIVGAWVDRALELHRVVALAADGSVRWASPYLVADERYPGSGYSVGQAAIYDQDQDGVPEVYAYGAVLDGATGAVLWGEGALPQGSTVVVDLDGDGTQELVTEVGIWNEDRTPRCRYGFTADDLAVADMDGDGVGDILASNHGLHGTMHLNDHCASVLFHFDVEEMPLVADMDADGRPDLGGDVGDAFTVRRHDGERLWTTALRPLSPTNASVFDFDADGFPEVVLGESSLYIMSGMDGAYREVTLAVSNAYFRTHPMAVDVDGDGEAEIVQTGARGLTVLKDNGSAWPPGLTTWNQRTFHRSHIRDDLSIPTYNGGNWPEFNDFRSSTTRPGLGSGAGQVDATVDLVNLCEVECDRGVVELTVRVANQGLRDAPDGIGLGLYAVAEDGSRTMVDVGAPGDQIRAGFTGSSNTFTLSMDDLPTGSLVLVADDNGEGRGRITECDESNNELLLEGLCADE